MKPCKTLNTRILPLSLLISSLVSGGAIAAQNPNLIYTPTGDFKRIAEGGVFISNGGNELEFETIKTVPVDEIEWNAADSDAIQKLRAEKQESEKEAGELLDQNTTIKDAKEAYELANQHYKVRESQVAAAEVVNNAVDKLTQQKNDTPTIKGITEDNSEAKILIDAITAKMSTANQDDLKTAINTVQSAATELQTGLTKFNGQTPMAELGAIDLTDLQNKLKAAITEVTDEYKNIINNNNLDPDDTKAEFEQLTANYESVTDAYSKYVPSAEEFKKQLKTQEETAAAVALIGNLGSLDELKTAEKTKNESYQLELNNNETVKDKLTELAQHIKTVDDKILNLIPQIATLDVEEGKLAKKQQVKLGDTQTIKNNAKSVDGIILGTQKVEEDGIAEGSIVHNRGKLELAEGANSFGAQIAGELVNTRGTDTNSIVKEGGMLTLSGVAAELAKSVNAKIEENASAILDAFSEATGMESHGNVTVKKDARVIDSTVNGGTFALEEGSRAENTIVNSGTFTIADGAIADKTTLNNATVLTLSEHQTANNTTVNQGAVFELKDKAKTEGTVVNHGKFNIASDTTADRTDLVSGTIDVVQGSIVTNTYIRKDGTLNLAENAVTTGTSIDGGQFNIAKGATATNTTLHNGVMAVADEGIANNTTMKAGKFSLGENASATDTTIENGQFDIAKGATATNTVFNDGVMNVAAEGIANNTTMKAGKFSLGENAKATDTTIENGQFDIAKGATATNTVFNDGVMNVAAEGIANNTQVKGGKFNLMSMAQAFKLEVDGGIAHIAGVVSDNLTLKQGEVNLANTAQVTGNISAAAGSNINMAIGANTAQANLTLGTTMVFTDQDVSASNAAEVANRSVMHSATRAVTQMAPAQIEFKDVVMDGGTFDFTKLNTKQGQIKMASLQGEGQFNLGTLTNATGAAIKIAGQANGDFVIQINESGKAPVNLNLIQADVNNANFKLTRSTYLGNYQYELVNNGNGSVSLVADKTKLAPSTAGILAVGNTTPVIYNAELSSVQNRLDRLATFSSEDGVWGSYLNNQFSVNGTAANFSQSLNGMTLGGDKTAAMDNGSLTLGGFASYSRSTIKSDFHSSGDVDSKSVGAYAQYQHKNGYFVNGTLKANQFDQKLNVEMFDGEQANSNSKFAGLGMSVKAGKHIQYQELTVTPYVGISNFNGLKNDITMSNGMTAKSDNSRSLMVTAGVNSGYSFNLTNGASIKPYASLSVDQEVISNNKVVINGEQFKNDLSGTRANIGLGVNAQLTKAVSVNTEVKFGKGKNIESPITANIGVGYSF
ncbi:autotransporter protein [Yersinia rohdei]|uniref:autotransporter outer membrane beta-barrel domain-containing protein n=1 Tax=Yersinia rohdei TaxID=29485 RepID=UPI0005E12DFA|nr:autotransporter outer membrane beta-barrel domain-containing protein [Yersinia rohdei]CNJ45200.1 autotransporter protein [Yersinia rohdei]